MRREGFQCRKIEPRRRHILQHGHGRTHRRWEYLPKSSIARIRVLNEVLTNLFYTASFLSIFAGMIRESSLRAADPDRKE
ncbi:hypothetical protein [Singulisphaera sp. PoT]|uniref:hypothetical protein n=1 Tax=Singulisphaera sp. PoT TaxID=3411797 RepID=UPI003BF50E23